MIDLKATITASGQIADGDCAITQTGTLRLSSLENLTGYHWGGNLSIAGDAVMQRDLDVEGLLEIEKSLSVNSHKLHNSKLFS